MYLSKFQLHGLAKMLDLPDLLKQLESPLNNSLLDVKQSTRLPTSSINSNDSSPLLTAFNPVFPTPFIPQLTSAALCASKWCLINALII
jgi:hypothetical protein